MDESGKPQWSHPEPEYVLTALMINERSWKEINEKMRGIKLKYFPDLDPDSVELHATDIFNHRKSFKNLPLQVRLDVFADILSVISDSECCICATVLRKDRITKKTMDIQDFALDLIFERITFFLNESNGKSMKDGLPEEYGIVLMDSENMKEDNRVRLKFRQLFERGTRFVHCDYLIEDPLFVNSEYRHLSQLVDCAAYCIRRYIRRTDDEAETRQFSEFYAIIEPKMLRGRGFVDGYGLKVFPK